MTHQEIKESLKSAECPGCNNKKGRWQSFCGRCYYSLPSNLSMALYKGMGRGYEEAFTAAVAHLRQNPSWGKDAGGGKQYSDERDRIRERDQKLGKQKLYVQGLLFPPKDTPAS